MTPTSPSEEWAACEPGEVQGLVQRLQRKRRAEKRQVGVVVASACLLCAFVGSWLVMSLGVTEANYGGIVCSQVRKQAREFVQKKTSPETTAQIEAHIKQCDHCREQIEELLAEVERERVVEQNRAAGTVTLLVSGK